MESIALLNFFQMFISWMMNLMHRASKSTGARERRSQKKKIRMAEKKSEKNLKKKNPQKKEKKGTQNADFAP